MKKRDDAQVTSEKESRPRHRERVKVTTERKSRGHPREKESRSRQREGVKEIFLRTDQKTNFNSSYERNFLGD